MERKRTIEAAGLTWSVVESVPVHEAIKTRSQAMKRCVENYKSTIRNLGACGIDTVCYNFMPVLDWSRTDLTVERADGSITTRFDPETFAAFDIHILKRAGAAEDYPERRACKKRRRMFRGLTADQRTRLAKTVLLGLPGSLEAFTLEGLRQAIGTLCCGRRGRPQGESEGIPGAGGAGRRGSGCRACDPSGRSAVVIARACRALCATGQTSSSSWGSLIPRRTD